MTKQDLTRRAVLRTLLAGAFAASYPSGARAVAPGVGAAFVSDFIAETTALLGDSAIPAAQLRLQVTALLQQHFDLPAIERFVLGVYWLQASAAQQAEVQRLLAELISGAVMRRLTAADRFNVEVLAERLIAGGDVLVATRVAADRDRQVEWRVRFGADGARLVDLVVDGVSMAIARRDEFTAIIAANGSIDALIVALRERVYHGR